MPTGNDKDRNIAIFEDVLGLKHLKNLKYVAKLVDTVFGAIGDWTRPWRMRREADAEAYATRVTSAARRNARELDYRQLVRFEHLGRRTQRNIESITFQAAQIEVPDVDDQPVDEDWAVAFFAACEDVGNEQMQSLWAKLLAGEVAHPGTYSLRTLQVVKTLSQLDAQLFTNFCSYCWKFEEFGPNGYVAFAWPIFKYEYDAWKLAHLRTMGLVSDEIAISHREVLEPRFEYFGKRYQVRCTVGSIREMKVIPLSEAGAQLFPISGATSKTELPDRVKEVFWGGLEGGTVLTRPGSGRPHRQSRERRRKPRLSSAPMFLLPGRGKGNDSR